VTGFRVRPVRFHELDEETISRWGLLEERALEGNAYISPRFMIPALRHLATPKEARESMFVFVEKTGGGGGELVGAGVFVRSSGSHRFPLPHLRAYTSPHSYLSGILVDRDEAEGAIRTFFRFFCGKDAPWHGVEFENFPSEGRQAEWIAEVADEFGVTWTEHKTSRRAVFLPAEGGEKYMQASFTSRRIKNLRQTRRRLEEMGEVRWRVLRGSEATEITVERFLEIEHTGWKAKDGTSLRSQPSHEEFFREMVTGFRKTESLFFTELSLDGVVIALTSNLISGGAGFAFKIGFHADFAKISPGVLNEIECIRHAPGLFKDLEFIDSGAEEGSFIEQFWMRRRILSSGLFGTTSIGRRMLSGIQLLRRAKRWSRSLNNRNEEKSCPQSSC
jgi:hypothetical protein